MYEQALEEIHRLKSELIKEQQPDGSWNYPFDTGVITDCSMIILLSSLKMRDEPLIERLVGRIVSKQEANGTWKLYPDEEDGNLSVTILAYYALLYSNKVSKRDPKMHMTKQFILKKGGIAEAEFFTKIILAVTGQYDWSSIPVAPIEVVLLPTTFPLNLYDLSIFARVNLVPILILSNQRFAVRTKDAPDLSDLLIHRQDQSHVHSREWNSFMAILSQGVKRLVGAPAEIRKLAYEKAVQYMVNRIEPDGTFCSYFSATFFMIYALLSQGFSKQHPIILNAINGLKTFEIEVDGLSHLQYTTASVWNTALISYALQEAGEHSSSIPVQQANEYVRRRQHYVYGDWAVHNSNALPGGWGFSTVNTFNPDIDDTTAVLRAIRNDAISKASYRVHWDRGVQWLISSQNDDGGFPAFEKNVDKSILTWLPFEGGRGMLLDPSSADLTGRTLEFLGNFSGAFKDQYVIKRAVNWLIRNQEKNGSWYARWGICYIYGTWCALTGLVAVNVRRDHPTIRKAVSWLYSIQQEDGGFGESCKSDIEKSYVPLTFSTRTHTAWALDALLAAEEKITPQMEKAFNFLINPNNELQEACRYPKGQGLAGSFYIHYPSYEYLFPLLTLSHYLKKCER